MKTIAEYHLHRSREPDHTSINNVTSGHGIHTIHLNNNNNNNNTNRVYTLLSGKCYQSRVFISQCHMNHIIQYYAY